MTTLRDLVQELGPATVRVESDAVDFELENGINGYVHDNRDPGVTARLTFFVAIDDAATELAEWIGSVPPPAFGTLHQFSADDVDGVRLLVEIPLDEDARRRFRDAAFAADTYARLWRREFQEETPLLATLASGGVAAPPAPLPHEEIFNFAPWHWGTVWLNPFGLYMFEVEAMHQDGVFDRYRPVFAMSHAGHGMNSYGLNVVTSHGPVVAFVQHGYGGVYMQPVQSLMEIAATYTRLHVLFRALSADTITGSHQPRWLLAFSNFRGACDLVDLEEARRGRELKRCSVSFGTEGELFAVAAERLSIDTAHPLGSLSW